MKARSLLNKLLSLALTCAFASVPVMAAAAPKNNVPVDASDALAAESPADVADMEPELVEGERRVVREGSVGEEKLTDELNKLDPGVMLRRGDDFVTEMRQALRTATSMLMDARKQRDLVLISCVNERIKQITNVLAVAEDSLVRLRTQADSGDIDGARLSFTKVSLGRNKVATLWTQCQSCVGVESYFYGDTQVRTEVNPELTGGDPFFQDHEKSDDVRVITTKDFHDYGGDTVNLPPPSSQYRD